MRPRVWSTKSTSDFATYSAIVFGDGRFPNITGGTTPLPEGQTPFMLCTPMLKLESSVIQLRSFAACLVK